MNLVKFLIDNWMLVAMAAVSGGLLVWQLLQKQQSGAIGTAEAVRLINREKAVLIDVCAPSEFAASHASGARNIPLDKLDGAKELPTNKALPLVVMCASGARSGRAASQLRKAGHERAIAIAGGLAAWREAGLPTEKTA